MTKAKPPTVEAAVERLAGAPVAELAGVDRVKLKAAQRRIAEALRPPTEPRLKP